MVIRNPVLSGMYPDSSWIWDDERDCAILVNLSFELVPGLPIHISMDMGGWTPLAYAVDERMAHRLLLDYVEGSGGLYAPTLRRVGGRYVIACAVSRLDGERARSAGVDEGLLRHIVAAQGNFVIESESPEGPWRGGLSGCLAPKASTRICSRATMGRCIGRRRARPGILSSPDRPRSGRSR